MTAALARAAVYAVIYAALTGMADLGNWLAGVLLGMAVAWLCSSWSGRRPDDEPVRPVGLPWFVWGTVQQIVGGSLRTLRVLLGLRDWRTIGWFTCPHAARTEHGLAVLALVLSSAPGTVVAETEPGTRTLVVNSLDGDGPDSERQDIHRFYTRFQRRSLP